MAIPQAVDTLQALAAWRDDRVSLVELGVLLCGLGGDLDPDMVVSEIGIENAEILANRLHRQGEAVAEVDVQSGISRILHSEERSRCLRAAAQLELACAAGRTRGTSPWPRRRPSDL